MVGINMEMPKYCNDCDFVIDSFGYCNRAEEHIPNYEFYSETNERPDFCPLVEIGTCKDCSHYDPLTCNSGTCLNPNMQWSNEVSATHYCADFEKVR